MSKIINSKNSKALAEAIEILADTQQAVSQFVPGATDLPLIAEQVATYCFSLIQEVGELATELKYKPWKQSDDYQLQKIADETADVFAFLGLILYYITTGIGVSPEELALRYQAKSITNVKRFYGIIKQYPKVTVDTEKVEKVLKALSE